MLNGGILVFSKFFDIHAELKTGLSFPQLEHIFFNFLNLLFIINLFPKFLPERYSCSTENFINEIR